MEWKEQSEKDLLLQSPFLARLLLSLPLVETTRILTMGTDGRKILYNPEFANSLTIPEATGVRLHELLHVMLGHHVRRDNRSPQLWNVATDFEVNQIVIDLNYTLPEQRLYDPQYKDMCAEQIYDELKDTDDGKMMQALDQLIDGVEGDDNDPEIKALREAAKQEFEKRAASDLWGDLPGSVKQRLDKMLTPKKTLAEQIVPYLTQLKAVGDETWAPPSRRCSVLPSEEFVPTGNVTVCVDTSGSMERAQIEEILQLIMGTMEIATVNIVFADTDVQEVCEDISELPEEIPGGGGTSFIAALEKAEEMNSDVIVYCTDGYGEFPSVAPNASVLWLYVGTSADDAPFGTTVRVEL